MYENYKTIENDLMYLINSKNEENINNMINLESICKILSKEKDKEKETLKKLNSYINHEADINNSIIKIAYFNYSTDELEVVIGAKNENIRLISLKKENGTIKPTVPIDSQVIENVITTLQQKIKYCYDILYNYGYLYKMVSRIEIPNTSFKVDIDAFGIELFFSGNSNKYNYLIFPGQSEFCLKNKNNKFSIRTTNHDIENLAFKNAEQIFKSTYIEIEKCPIWVKNNISNQIEENNNNKKYLKTILKK